MEEFAATAVEFENAGDAAFGRCRGQIVLTPAELSVLLQACRIADGKLKIRLSRKYFAFESESVRG
jgi:hypothetical protein